MNDSELQGEDWKGLGGFWGWQHVRVRVWEKKSGKRIWAIIIKGFWYMDLYNIYKGLIHSEVKASILTIAAFTVNTNYNHNRCLLIITPIQLSKYTAQNKVYKTIWVYLKYLLSGLIKNVGQLQITMNSKWESINI